MSEIDALLKSLDLSEHLGKFTDHDIDGALLRELTAEDLKEIGVSSLGHRKRILAAIDALSVSDISSAPSPAQTRIQSSEQRREVTVLFSDLSNFTKITGELEVEDLHDLLADLYKAFDGIVRRMGGTVERHIGDCVMAVFGAPVSYGNDVERALRASIEMHKAMEGISKKHGRDYTVHIGIAAGRVLFSSRGQGEMADSSFTIMGTSVNLASRLADKANGRETLISDQILQSIGDHIICKPREKIEAKGFEGLIETHQFIEFRKQKTDRPFIGRKTEVAIADAALESCVTKGKGKAIYIRGEAGIGKTAFLDKVVSLAEARQFKSHRALLLDFGLGDNNAADRVILAELSALDVGATQTAVENHSSSLLQNGILDQKEAYFFNSVLGVQPEGAMKTYFDGLDSKAHVHGRHNVICKLARQKATETPFLIAIEDLHWADKSALALVMKLAELSAENRFVLMLTSRVQGDPLAEILQNEPATFKPDAFTQFDLAPLSKEESLELAKGFYRPTDDFIQECLEKAEGNPLFLDQLLRHAYDTNDGSMPGSIQSLVQSRIDRLSPDDRRVLNAAAVLGQRFSLGLAIGLAGIEVYDERALVDASLIKSTGSGYLFSHALIREGVYQTILRDDLHALHFAAADWFHSVDNVLYAEHLSKAGSADAPGAYLVAARDAFSERRLEAAVELIDKAVLLPVTNPVKSDLMLLKADCLRDLGRGEQSIEVLEEVAAISASPLHLMSAKIGMIATMRILDRLDGTEKLIQEAEAIGLEVGLDKQLSELYYLKGSLCFPKGDFEGCLKAQKLAGDFAEKAKLPELRARALSGLGDAYYAQGRMLKAHGVFEECLSLCDQHDLGSIESSNRFMLGTTKIYMNQTGEALDHALRSAELAKKIGQLRPEIVSRLTAGWIYQTMAEHDASENQVMLGLQAASQLGAKRFEPFLEETLIRVYASKGLHEKAKETADHALSKARELGMMNFIGPWILSSAALVTKDRNLRDAFLDEGEKLLKDGCVGHNYFRFYHHAVVACIDHGEWQRMRNYCNALDEYTQKEPTPWSDFYIKYGRTMADMGEGDTSAKAELIALGEVAGKAGLHTTKRSINEFLQKFS